MEPINRNLQSGRIAEGWDVDVNPHAVEGIVFDDLLSIVRYLRQSYGIELFSPIIDGIDPDLRKDNSGKDWTEQNHYQFTQAFIKYTGLISKGSASYQNFDVRVEDGSGTFVAQNSEVFVFQDFSGKNNFGEFQYNGRRIAISGETDGARLLFQDNEGRELGSLDFTSWVESQDIQEDQFVDRIRETRSPEELSLGVNLDSFGPIQLAARRLRFQWREDSWSLVTAEFWILVPRD